MKVPINDTNDSTLQVDHVDRNKRNNKLNDLEWVTCKENINRVWKNKLCENTRDNALMGSDLTR